MGRHGGGKRARSGSFQQSEGDAEDPLARLRAFQARMFDLKPEEPSRAAASAFSDGIPAVQWKPCKKSKVRKKQRLVDASVEEDAAVPTVKFALVKSKSKKKTEKETVKEEKKERPNVVRIPGQLKPRAAAFETVANKEVPKKLKHNKKKLHAVANGAQGKAETNGATGKASVAVPTLNDPAAKSFEEGEDPLAAVMRHVQEKMEAESARSAKKSAFAASMATDKFKKKKEKKRKSESEAEAPLVKTETTTSGVSAAVNCVNGSEPETEAVEDAPVQPEAKKRKGAQPPIKKEDVSEVPVPPSPSPKSGVCPSTASPQKTLRNARNQKKKMRKKLLKMQKLQQSHQPDQQPGEQQKHPDVKVEHQNGPIAPSKTAEPALNRDAGTHSDKQEEKPAISIVAATSPEHPRAKPKAGKRLNNSQPKQQHAKTLPPVVTKLAPKSVEKPSKPVSTPAIPVYTQRPQSLPTSKPKKAVVSDSSSSDDSDSDSDAGRVTRHSLATLEASELSELSEDDAGAVDEPEASSSSEEDEDDARPGVQHQRQLFSALIDEAARDTWELTEVGRLVRLFSSLGWKRRTHETAKFLRHYCPELVSAEFLDGLDVKLSSKQLLGIFERGSGKPEVFLNKLASAIENNYLHAKDPTVAAALTRKVSELPDPSTRGICEFLVPLLESLSTVCDVGVILRRMCCHWQPERAASLVQQVLLTSVFDDLEGDQDEILEFMPQLKGLLDFPSRMNHEDADEDGNLVGLIASEDEGDGDNHSDGEGDEEDDPEAALGEIMSDDEDEDEDDEEYEGETDSEEEREAAIRYGPDQRRRRRSQFILDEADESEDEDEDEEDNVDDEQGWEELVGSEADE